MFSYRRISNESRSFAKIYGKYVDEKMILDDVSDFLTALKTHLLMKNYKLKKIDEYMNEVVIKNQHEMLKENVLSSKLKEVSSQMINKLNGNNINS
jgi:hypothetical protein